MPFAQTELKIPSAKYIGAAPSGQRINHFLLPETHFPDTLANDMSATTISRSSAKGEVRPSLRLGAIDVGANSIHMIVAQADADGGISTLWRLKESVGLGRLSFPSKKLSADAMERAITALGRFQQAANQRQAEKIIA